MSETKFTPGPWVVEKPRWYAPTDERHIYDTQGQLIARIPLSGRFQSVNETVVNAHLMSAAPEMYAEIQANCHKLLAFGLCDQEECADCSTNNLLRKARGEV